MAHPFISRRTACDLRKPLLSAKFEIITVRIRASGKWRTAPVIINIYLHALANFLGDTHDDTLLNLLLHYKFKLVKFSKNGIKNAVLPGG
jgi:hypothetical protein